jgi:uncharacterized protein YjdB
MKAQHVLRRALLLAAVCVLPLPLACGGDAPVEPVQPVTPVATTITLSTATLTFASVGATQQLSAAVIDQQGQAMPGATVTWASSDQTVATVSAAGVVTAVGNGSAIITATAGAAAATAVVTVQQVAASVTLSPASATLASIGDTVRLVPVVRDAGGAVVEGATVTWASSNHAVATVSQTGLVTAAGDGAASITATVGSVSAAAAIAVQQVVASVTIVPATAALASLGDSVQLTATVRDAGGAVMAGVVPTWTSSNPAVATVSAAGLVRAVANGSATITATVGSVSATAAITVQQVAASVTLSATALTLTSVGATHQLTALVRDARGQPYPDAPVTWATSDASVATVSPTGLVTATGSGTASITATSGGVSATTVVTVQIDAGPATITSVTPAVLVEGQQATISGTGFQPTGTTVTVDGLSAPIASASATQLVITAPIADCRPPRQAVLRVETGGTTALHNVSIRPQQLWSPAVGEWTWATSCLHLAESAADARYLVGLLSLSEVPSSLTPAALSAEVGSRLPAGAIAGSAFVTQQHTFRMPAAPASQPTAAALHDLHDLHAHSAPARDGEAAIRLRERQILQSLDLAAVRADAERLIAAQMVAVVPAAGDTLTLKVPSSCTQAVSVRAVVRHVGAGLIFLEDVANPVLNAFTQQQLQQMDAVYLQHTLPTLLSYFGTFADIDGNGRTLVLITREVNRLTNIDGFVYGVDLLPTSVCPAGNFAEIFYGVAPDPTGVYGRQISTTYIQQNYPPLIAHEVTHILQLTEIIHRGAALKTSWELEGGATLAEQLVGFRLFGHAPGQNLGLAAVQQGMDWYFSWVSDVASYFGYGPTRVPAAPEQCSWMGRPEEGNTGPCLNGRAVYGTPAMLLRTLLDRHGASYPGGEAAMMRALTASRDVGLANLANVTGEDAAALMAFFGIALWADDRVGSWITSWNLPEIFNALPPEARLLPYTSVSAQPNLSVSVRAGSNAYLLWSPPPGHDPTSLRIRTPAGGALPAHMRFWVVRIQ